MADNSNRTLVFNYLMYGTGGLVVVAIGFLLCKKSRRKRVQSKLFASVFSRFSSPNLSKALYHHKTELFGPLQRMISADRKLAKSGPGCVRILEIGIGNGTNLEFYPDTCRLISVEPNPYFETYFKKNLLKFPNTNVELFIKGSAEDMSLIPSNSIDAVVSTHVLCSVSNIDQCLEEIKRILVPNGHFYYVEHVAYSKPYCKSRQLQGLVNPIWKLICDGCELTRDISADLRAAGFSSIGEKNVSIDSIYYVMRPHIFGIAVK